MRDIVQRLHGQAGLDEYANSHYDKLHYPLLREAAAEIERLREMCINREEFIAKHNLWKEFSQYLSEPPAEGKSL